MPERLSEEGLAAFHEIAVSQVDDGSLPGLVALVACGDSVHVDTAGSLSLGGAPVRRDSVFRIASTTKPITGAATLALAGEGLLDIDEPVGRLLPELANPRVLRRMDGPLDDTIEAIRAISVRQLLTFTFGFGAAVEMFMSDEPWPIVAAANALSLGSFGPPQPSMQPEPDAWMAALGSLPLIVQPGERWLYNTGASVLGVLLARAAGAPFGEVLRTRIFEPLGMKDTAFWTSDTSRLATTYQPTGTGLEVWDTPGGQWSSPPGFADGAGGLVSTVDDLLAFARMLLRGGAPVLTRDATSAMTTDQLTLEQRTGAEAFLEDRSWSFCQSVVTDGPHAGAYGWDGGLGTSWYVDPAHDLTVIVLTQRMFETSDGPALHRDLEAAAYQALTAG